jgi:LacI family transcriptional regulator
MKKSTPIEGALMARPATIKDVARVADVSIGTVSGVIHGKASVSGALRERVLAAISTLNYSPNSVAQSMRMGATHTIGVVVPHLTAVISKWLAATQEILYDAGFTTVLAVANGDRKREADLLQALLRRKIDALLVAQTSEYDEDVLEILKRATRPIVLIDRDLPEWADAVMVDHKGAARRAVDYLIQLGHRRIAFIGGGPEIYPSRERLSGYKAALAHAGIPEEPTLLRIEDYLADYGFQQTQLLMTGKAPPTAMMVSGLALPGVLRALRFLRLEFPADVSIIALSDSDMAELIQPAISVERWEMADVGKMAARLVLERISQKEDAEPKRVRISSEFVARDSCAPPKS